MTIFTLIGGIYAGLFLAKVGLTFKAATLPFRILFGWVFKKTNRKGRRTVDRSTRGEHAPKRYW